jgi:hypothetical protein
MEGTRIGLQFLQVGANKLALEELCKKKDEKYNAALAEFNKGWLNLYCCCSLVLADGRFQSLQSMKPSNKLKPNRNIFWT